MISIVKFMKRCPFWLTLLLFANQAHAFGPYYANCNGQHVSTTITSVFGEIRTTTTTPTVPYRFHAGVDINDSYCVLNSSVGAIEGGTVTVPPNDPACVSQICVRVTNGNHAFDYVDIASSLSAGATVQAGDIVGRIANLGEGPHLHLNEIQGMGAAKCGQGGFGCFRINPQRTNGLIFSDPDIPAFSTMTVGSVSNQKVILVQYTGSGPKGGQTPIPFSFVSNTFYVHGQVDALAAIHSSGTITRKGVYLADLAPIASGQPCTGLNIAPVPNIAFNTLFDQATSSQDMLTIYFQQFPDSNGFILTDFKKNNDPTTETQTMSWNTDLFPEGPRQACVSAMTYPQGPVRSLGVNVVIDRTPPQAAFKATDGAVLAPAGDGVVYTSSSAIQVEGTDTGSGIASMTVQGINVSYSSTSYITGVSTDVTVRFPDSPAVLANGSYSVTMVDLAGNVQIASFTVVTLDTATATLSLRDPYGGVIGSSILSSTAVVIVATGAQSGIASINITNGAGYSSTATWTVPASSAVFGSHFFSAGGTYTITARTAAGGVFTRTLSVTYVSPAMTFVFAGSSANDVFTTSSYCTLYLPPARGLISEDAHESVKDRRTIAVNERRMLIRSFRDCSVIW